MKSFAGNGVGFINPWTGEEMPGMAISDHDEDSLHGKFLNITTKLIIIRTLNI